MEPEFQMQHRLPKVYLKRFGYREIGRRYVSVLEKTSNKTEQKEISTFTAEENIFDYSILSDINERRHFEKLCNKFETQYPVIIESIKHGPLSLKCWNILCQFMATLIVRSEKHRQFYCDLMEKADTRNKFFDEITMSNEESRADLDACVWSLGVKETLQLVSVVAGEHIAKCLTKFTYIILKNSKNNGKKWFTSDNPVVIDKQGEYGYIIPLEAEIYFPLSKDFCIFLYHEESQIRNHPLRKLEQQKVHECDEVSHAYITMQIVQNAYRYILLPIKLSLTFNEFIPLTNRPRMRI